MTLVQGDLERFKGIVRAIDARLSTALHAVETRVTQLDTEQRGGQRGARRGALSSRRVARSRDPDVAYFSLLLCASCNRQGR